MKAQPLVHEGNYALPDLLNGARALEREKSASKKQWMDAEWSKLAHLHLACVDVEELVAVGLNAEAA